MKPNLTLTIKKENMGITDISVRVTTYEESRKRE
jgi:hypothetical protein